MADFTAQQEIVGQVETLVCTAHAAIKLGDPERAAAALNQARALIAALAGNHELAARVHRADGALHAATAPTIAISLYQKALAEARLADSAPEQAEAHRALAELHGAQHDRAAARRHAEQAATLMDALRPRDAAVLRAAWEEAQDRPE